MKYTYSREELREWLVSNVDTLIEDPKFQALIVEVKVTLDVGNKFVNKAGYDEITADGIRIETKYTNYLMKGNMFILSIFPHERKYAKNKLSRRK